MAFSFEEYYKQVGLVGPDEWASLEESLKTPLPITFRILANTIHARWVTDFIRDCEKSLQDITDEFVFAPLSWYPGGSAWELKASRKVLRSHSRLKELSQFLIKQSENGVIIRQEAVSMVPALFLIQEVKSDDALLLDLCAAPGSKTSQLLEALELVRSPESIAAGLPPRGAVIANDINPTRAHMLSHHLKYQWSPSLLISLHNAALYPRLFRTDANGNHSAIKYTGVLCDVPCSGDGTIRKSPRAWTTWNVKSALGLHCVQMRILKKGVSLCEIGGRVVYSTCSFNPIEDEAVVAGVLRHSEGCLEVEKVSLEGLKARPGITQWDVLWKKDAIFKQWDDVPEELRKTRIWPSMFQPEEPEIRQELAKCNRFVPHDNDTGGFFVCVFRKVKECPWERRVAERAVLGIEMPEGEAEESSEEEDVSTQADSKLRKQDGDTSSKPAAKMTPSVKQKDIIPVAGDAKLQGEVTKQCLARYNLMAHDSLVKHLWYRPHIEHAPANGKSKKRDRKGQLKGGKSETDLNNDTAAGAAAGAAAAADGESKIEPTFEHVEDKGPRKIIFVSEKVAEVLEAHTMKCRHRVAGAGTLFSELKTGHSTRLTPVGFRYAKAHLERYVPSYTFTIPPSIVEVTKETMREIFAIAETEQGPAPKTLEEVKATEEALRRKANEASPIGTENKENATTDPAATSSSVAESGTAGGAQDDTTATAPLWEYKHFPNRFNFMAIAEDSPVRQIFASLNKENHYLFMVKVENNDLLYVPLYIGKRNADLLVTDPVRRSLMCLLS